MYSPRHLKYFPAHHTDMYRSGCQPGPADALPSGFSAFLCHSCRFPCGHPSAHSSGFWHSRRYKYLLGFTTYTFPVRFNYYFIQILYLFCPQFLHLFHNMFQPNFQETQHLLFVHVHTIELQCYYHIIPCIT